MRADLAAIGARAAGIRAFEPDDVPALGALMHRAYLDTIDHDGETPEQAAAEIVKTVEGAYGAFLPSCSMLAVRDGAIVSATLVTRCQDRPFVAFTFTDPAHAGRGLARACLQASMGELHAQGERELRLVVTLANAPAVALYTRLGFEIEGRDEG
ncbi:MAG: GNAT family N-acetyltransferase [Rubrivivax sp.]|nr:GNAT family N-acetyltransferase [Rubrivivax sp.]